MNYELNKKQSLAILGSTGSIGTQTLDVVRENPDLFDVYAITANNSIDKLIAQAREFNPEVVVVGNEAHYNTLKDALADLPIKIFAGREAIAQVAAMDAVTTVVTAMVGYSGLAPTIAAVKAGKRIALANKETLVVAGDLITRLVQEYHAAILPVDSEHGAIFQCLVGEHDQEVEKIIPKEPILLLKEWLINEVGVTRPDTMVVPVSQVFSNYNASVQKIDYCFGGVVKLSLSPSPLWPFEFSNCMLEEDTRMGNKKPLKRTANAKVDNVQCLCSCFNLEETFSNPT